MENKRKWDPVEEIEGVDELMNSGAAPEETAYSLDDILKEYGEAEEPSAPETQPEAEPEPDIRPEPEDEDAAAPEEAEPFPAEEPPQEPEQPPEEAEEPEPEFDTAAFIGRQVDEAIGDQPEEDTFQEDTTSNGLRAFFMEARRKSAEKKHRKEQIRREREMQEDMAQAAAAMAETVEDARAETESVKKAAENVVNMPISKARPFRESFGRIQDKARDFADNMYADAVRPEEDTERPEFAADEEEVPVPQKKAFWRERRPRKEEPKAPDTPAEEQARRYRLGLRSMRSRLWCGAVLAAALLFLSVAGDLGLPMPQLLTSRRVMAGILTWGLALGAAILLDVLWLGLTAPFRRRPGLHTLTALAVIATVLDGLYAAVVGRDGPLPFSAMALFSLLGAGLGAYQRKRALSIACRTAAGAAEPYRVTLDEDKWGGSSAFYKEAGTAEGFGSQIQAMDGAQRIYRLWTPLLLVAALVCAVLASVGRGRPDLLLWCLSTILVAASPVAGLMAFGQPYLRLTRRLDRSGAALAGWEGAASMRGKANILIKDEDLFPEGSIGIRSIKNFDKVSQEKLVGCIASMLRSAGSGLYHLFDAELRRQGGFYRRVDNLKYYPVGGLGADIRGEQVLIGTHLFLSTVNIHLEPGMKLNQAVYCVINGELAGFFGLDYQMSHYTRSALQSLIKSGVRPVLATRDFNVNPVMLQDCVSKNDEVPIVTQEQIGYPSIERRWEFSEEGQPHNQTLGALLTREGIGTYADAVLGGRRLCSVVRVNAVIAVLASLAGIALSFYLTWSLAFDSLSPLSMMVFLLLWAVPNLLISGAADQF